MAIILNLKKKVEFGNSTMDLPPAATSAVATSAEPDTSDALTVCSTDISEKSIGKANLDQKKVDSTRSFYTIDRDYVDVLKSDSPQSTMRESIRAHLTRNKSKRTRESMCTYITEKSGLSAEQQAEVYFDHLEDAKLITEVALNRSADCHSEVLSDQYSVVSRNNLADKTTSMDVPVSGTVLYDGTTSSTKTDKENSSNDYKRRSSIVTTKISAVDSVRGPLSSERLNFEHKSTNLQDDHSGVRTPQEVHFLLHQEALATMRGDGEYTTSYDAATGAVSSCVSTVRVYN